MDIRFLRKGVLYEGIYRSSLIIFMYSFIGWLWETIYCSIKAKKFIYRGFLIGPYCPIYGFGILSVLYFLNPFQNNLFLLYILSAVMVTVLEYITSYALEKLFHASWWDYKDVPLNINGRVAIPVSLFWGIDCVLIVKVIQPKVLILEQFLANRFGLALPLLLLVLISSDLVYTLINMQSFKKVTAEMSALIEERKVELEKNLNEKRTELATNLSELKEEIGAKRKEFEKATWLDELKENVNAKKILSKLNFSQKKNGSELS
ncbi:putative ABC transporter permease [Enterococcus rivorum]|uniref:putative ABC transporter permease n=1 Tax=Enterococcus rivorum TaxID=762845 RepID=UPI003634734D